MEIKAGDNCLWGEVEEAIKISEGIYWIYTPDEDGGVLIHKDCDFAIEGMSGISKELAKMDNDWYAYGIDNAWSIPMYEMIYNDCGLDWEWEYYTDVDCEIVDTVITNLKKFYPEYAAARGVQ